LKSDAHGFLCVANRAHPNTRRDISDVTAALRAVARRAAIVAIVFRAFAQLPPLSGIAWVGATVGCVFAPEDVRVSVALTWVAGAARVTITVQVPPIANVAPAVQGLVVPGATVSAVAAVPFVGVTVNGAEASSVKGAPVVLVTVIVCAPVVVPKLPTAAPRGQLNNWTA
jgi:hypothetical protein